MSAVCYLVGTPIGNLKDITLRAIETLERVDVIASEDTRRTRILLEHYSIKKPLISYHQHKEREGAEEIMALLDSGKNVAVVTDAGMPGISDPGAVLVRELRARGYLVTVIPGATAVTSAISLGGMPGQGFCFLGFLPPKQKDRQRAVENIKNLDIPLVFYSAPHDIESDIKFLHSVLGDRKVLAIKEITKIFETVYEGRLGDIQIENKKGEFVLIVEGKDNTAIVLDSEGIKKELNKHILQGVKKSAAVKKVAEEFGISKNTVYAESLDL